AAGSGAATYSSSTKQLVPHRRHAVLPSQQHFQIKFKCVAVKKARRKPPRCLNSLPIVLVLILIRADPIIVGVVVAAIIVAVVVPAHPRRCGTGGDSIGGTTPTVAGIPGYRTARTTGDWWATPIAGPDRATRYWMRRPRSTGDAIAATTVET